VSAGIQYRLRIRNGSDDADLFVISSIPDDDNPYIAEPPDGDGESLDPLTGKVEVGSYTIRVIDAVDTITLDAVVATDGFEYADVAALDAAWPETDTMGADSTWTVSTTVLDSGVRAAELIILGTLGAGENCYRSRTFTGLAPSTAHTVSLRVWLNYEEQGSTGIAFGLEVVGGTAGYIEEHGPINAWRTVTATGTTNGSGELTVRVGAFDGVASTADRLARFDTLEIVAATGAVDRIITGYLADATGRQQLLSKRAFIEERENEGAWVTIQAGYVTDLSLVDALQYEFSIGSTQRIEQTKRVFDRVPNPGEFPTLTSKHDGTAISGTGVVLDRASCIVGGPIIGNWGPYEDRGRPVFRVDQILGGNLVRLKWVEGFVHYHEREPPVEDDVTEIMNNAALEYLDSTAPVPYPGAAAFQLAALPGLVCRLYDAGTGAWHSDHMPMALGPTNGTAARLIGDWFFVGGSVEVHVAWVGTLPAEGDRYRLAVFPETASERNPFHVSGHPVDIAAALLTQCGLGFDADSATDAKADLGSTLVVHLRVTEGSTLIEFLENTLYGPFGFATRLNDAGEHEFFLTRQVGAASVGTITLDDLHTDDGTIWNLKEQSAANRVVWESRSFLVNDAPSTYDLNMPIDGIQDAKITVEVTPSDATNEHAVFGDREIRFELPGEIEGYSTGTEDNPGPLDHFVAAIANPLFDWQGRGAIRGEFSALRGSAAYTAKIGETLTLDVAHYPSAVVGDTPTSRRGSQARRAFVLQRTRTPEGAAVSFEDRGPVEDPGIVPTFTLDPDDEFPNTIVTATVTNETDLLGYLVRVEMLTAAVEPAAAQFVRMWTPGSGDNPFDLPPVCAGSVVWVRMRAESGSGDIGAWSAFQSEDLPNLTIPSGLATVVDSTQVTLTWTNGEDSLPIEVLFRLDGDTVYTTATVLPAGTTSYTWTLPDAEADYNLAIRYRAGPGGCVSLVATADVTTDVALGLTAPINPAAWADGAGTFGMEVDGTAFPSGTEVWVAPESDVGSGISGAYALAGEMATTHERMRFQYPFLAPQDGLLRFLKARHRRGEDVSDFCDEVSVNPWTLIDPPPDPEPEPVPDSGLGVTPVPIVMLGAGLTRRFTGIAAAFTRIAVRDKFPLHQFRAMRIAVEVADTSTLDEGVLVAARFRHPISGEWIYVDGDSGPYMALDQASLDAADPFGDADAQDDRMVVGDYVSIVDEALDDVQLEVGLIGGDESLAKDIQVTRVELQLVAEDVVDAPPPEITEPPFEIPGSCTVPSPVDMDTGWTGGNEAGVVWSALSDTTATVTLDGSGTGDNYWQKTLTGLEPDELYTFYLDATQTASGIGAFLQAVGGGTDTATTADLEILRVQVDASCDGEITLRWGITFAEGAGTGGTQTFPMDWANQAAAEADGFTVSGCTFNNGVTLGPYTTGVTVSASSPGQDHLRQTFTGLTVGAQYRAKMWAAGTGQASWRYVQLEIESGGTTKRANRQGNQGAAEIITDSVTIAADGELLVNIETNHVGSVFRVAGLVVEALTAGEAGAVPFEDLRMCLGTGLSTDPPYVPDGPNDTDPEPIPENPTGPFPPPPVGGARPFGIFNISCGGYGYWNSTQQGLLPGNTVDLLNLSASNDCMNMFKFGGERDWLSGGRFSYARWKAAVDAIAGVTRTMSACEAAIISRAFWGHFVIDEPFHKRWGGTITLAVLDAMCGYSKTLFPTLPTIVRISAIDDRLTRPIQNCDIYWAEYKEANGDCKTYRDRNIAAVEEMSADTGREIYVIMGLHYGAIDRATSGHEATPAQVRHYGGILASSTSDRVLALHGWRFTQDLVDQPGMLEATRYVRDLFASFE
jgi:hypothetical protein